jgi:hypothetical protein
MPTLINFGTGSINPFPVGSLRESGSRIAHQDGFDAVVAHALMMQLRVERQ